MKNNATRVLVIGVDAAEPRLLREMIDAGEMPALGELLTEGKWMAVEGSAVIGSGCVWPTFITGTDPKTHGVYGEWLWQPETMDISRYRGHDLTPFWKATADDGVTVGILDVPFMPLIGLREGFEISEWGPHDVLECKTEIGPERVADFVARKASAHPLSFGTSVAGADDYASLEKLGKASLEGIKLRGTLARELLVEMQPQLCLIGFTEIHRSGHYLWHTAEPHHEVYRRNGFGKLRTPQPDLRKIYREVDRQIGEIVQTAGRDTPVMVFSLHGMKPGVGAPAFLPALLCEWGHARMAGWEDQNWRERARALMAGVKRRLPAWLKKFYYNVMPRSTTHRVAQSTMLPLYDWPHTKAFSLPTDQHGWIRINLIGREAGGIVSTDRYEEICADIENRLRKLKSEDGQPLVEDVIRTASGVEDALRQRLPDLVVHWSDAVFMKPLRIKDSGVQGENVGTKYIGQHSGEGFCILRGAFEMDGQQPIRGQDMHRLILNALNNTENTLKRAVARP